MKSFQNEKGYALFLTVFIIILFSILAVSLITVVLSGANRTAVREDHTQAMELSDKGFEHLVNQINSELASKIDENGISKSHFVDELEAVLNKYKCENFKLENNSETGDYEACVDHWVDGDGENGNLLKDVIIRSKGVVDGREKEFESRVKIGANDVPDALKYAIGSHRCEVAACSPLPGEGNLILHGGVSIQGDIKVDGNIVTYDRGYAYLSGSDQWINSVKPNAKPGPNTNVSKLVLGEGKKVYTMTRNPNSYDQHINRNNFTGSGYKEAQLKEAFNIAPVLVSRSPVRDKIEITKQSNNYRYQFNDPGVIKLEGQSIQNKNYSSKKVFPYYVRSYRCGFLNLNTCYENRTDGTYTLSGNNTFGQFATNGNVKIRNTDKDFKTTTFENGMYVGGNLEIGNVNISDSEYNPNKYEKIRLNGPIYVNGNLTIKGVDAELNALIYVNGEVIIRNTRINGLNVNGREGSLIVFANKSIQIANNSVNQDDPSNIRGYFYSEDAFEMFGVGSNIRIEGGISARRIVLNAIRGRAKDYKFDNNAQKISNSDYFEGVAGQKNRNSRLQVIYNPEIINTYSDLKQQEPVVYKENIEIPTVYDREPIE